MILNKLLIPDIFNTWFVLVKNSRWFFLIMNQLRYYSGVQIYDFLINLG